MKLHLCVPKIVWDKAKSIEQCVVGPVLEQPGRISQEGASYRCNEITA